MFAAGTVALLSRTYFLSYNPKTVSVKAFLENRTTLSFLESSVIKIPGAAIYNLSETHSPLIFSFSLTKRRYFMCSQKQYRQN